MLLYVLALQATGCYTFVTARDMRISSFVNINYACTVVFVVEGVIDHVTNTPTSYFLTDVIQI